MATPETIKAALDRAAGIVSAKPAIGQRVYTNTAILEDGLACRIEEGSYQMTTDVPPGMGGEGSAPLPGVLLRAALSSCIATGFKMWAARRGLQIDRIAVTVETDVDARGQLGVCDNAAPGFGAIRIRIGIDSPEDESKLQEAVAVSLRYSPLIDVFANPQTVTTDVLIMSAA